MAVFRRGRSSLPNSSGEALSALDWSGDGPSRRMVAIPLTGGVTVPPNLLLYPLTTIYWAKLYQKVASGGDNIVSRTCTNPHYHSGWFYSNSFPDGSDWQSHPATPVNGNNIFQWASGDQALYYDGHHPYPSPLNSSDTQYPEVSVLGNDYITDDNTGVNAIQPWGQWALQMMVRTNPSTANFTHISYYDLSVSTTKLITKSFNFAPWDTDPNGPYPPHPCMTHGQSAWVTYAGNEELCGASRGWTIIQAALTPAQGQGFGAQSTSAGAKSYLLGLGLSQAQIFYLNYNPKTTDITDKSGNGNHAQWIGSGRPTNISFP